MRNRCRKQRWPWTWPWGTGVHVLTAGLLTAVSGNWTCTSTWAQPPYLPIGPAPVVVGPMESARLPPGQWLKDTYIGRPDMFYEPPPGYYARCMFGTMKAKADPHRFMLYRTDFLPGTNRLSPPGAARFNLMSLRLPGWLGPLVVEGTPDQPGLAEARRQTVLAALASQGQVIVPERVLIGPSLYPGTLGTDGANYYNVMITRDTAAPSAYTLSPNSVSSFAGQIGSGAAGGGP